jgi:glycosyltransferase involved in cell wall biosynthesis
MMQILRRWFFIPDDRCGWIPFAVIMGYCIIRKKRPDAIMTTSYPNSSHIVGLILKILTGIPWVADFRDAWTENPAFFDPPTRIHAFIQRWLEKCVAKRCDLLVSVTQPISDHFSKMLPSQIKKVKTLTNGYDENDFAKIKAEAAKKFTMVYTGTIYGSRSIVPFFQAISEVLKRHSEWKDDFSIEFYAALDGAMLEKAGKYEINDIIKVKGLKSYKECLREQMNAAILLLFIAPGLNAKVMMTQKVFEYLRSGRPILAMIPDCACKTMLKSLGDKYIAEPCDVQKISAHIEEMYKKWKSGRRDAPNRDNIDIFERKNLSRQFSSMLDEITH